MAHPILIPHVPATDIVNIFAKYELPIMAIDIVFDEVKRLLKEQTVLPYDGCHISQYASDKEAMLKSIKNVSSHPDSI